MLQVKQQILVLHYKQAGLLHLILHRLQVIIQAFIRIMLYRIIITLAYLADLKQLIQRLQVLTHQECITLHSLLQAHSLAHQIMVIQFIP